MHSCNEQHMTFLYVFELLEPGNKGFLVVGSDNEDFLIAGASNKEFPIVKCLKPFQFLKNDICLNYRATSIKQPFTLDRKRKELFWMLQIS